MKLSVFDANVDYRRAINLGFYKKRKNCKIKHTRWFFDTVMYDVI